MLTKLKLFLIPFILVFFINSCSADESTNEEGVENTITETEIEEIVKGIIEEEIPGNEMSEEIAEEVIEQIIEGEITDEETIEEITKEVIDEIVEEGVTDGETIEEIIEEVVDEMTEDETIEEPIEEPVTVTNGAVSTYGKLQVKGNQITSENTGEVVQLRGMSLFWSQWSEGAIFYHENTINYLVDEFNINIVRAAIGVDAADGGYVSSTTIAATETQKAFNVIQAAIDNDIYVIVDWHSHYAHLNDPDNYSYAKQFFTDVYNKFGNVPNIIYEPFNEPKFPNIGDPEGTNVYATWTDIKPYHEAIVNTLRNLGADNLIVCGTGIWSQALWEVKGEGYDNTINDDNVAYTLHFYSSSMWHQETLRNSSQAAIDAGLPVFVTEFGVTEESGDGAITPSTVELWWDLVNKNNLSWCNWSIANKDETSAAFNFVKDYELRTTPLTEQELEGLTLSQSGTMIKAELQKNN